MIAIVLALLRFVPLPLWTAVPVYMISSILLWLLAPVETSHKPLDELEQRVYRHRARLIWCVESLVMIVKRDAGGGKIPAASHTSVTGINKRTEKQKKNKRKKQNE